MTQRDIFLQEIKRLEAAAKSTNSFALRNDYTKAAVKMRKQLKQYDVYHKKTKKESK